MEAAAAAGSNGFLSSCVYNMHQSIAVSWEVPDDFRYAHAKEALYEKAPKDLWRDARIGDILEYLYSNKKLRLRDDQKQLVRDLAKDFA